MYDLNHIYKVGNLIRYLREEKGLSQSQLGKKIGVSNKTISKWENGRGYPDTLILLSLANELEITVDELLKGELINKKTNLKTNKINSTINYKAEITLFKNFLLSLIPIICLVLYFVLFIFCGLEKTLNNLVEFIINKPLNNHSDMILFLLVPLWLCVISQTIIAIFFVLKVKHLKTSKFVKIITSIVIFFGFSIQYIGVVIYMVIRLIIAKKRYKKEAIK